MKEIAVDFETYPFQPRLKAPRAVCLGWYDGQDEGILKRDAAFDQLALWLADPEVVLIWHNATFDMTVLAVGRPSLIPAIFAAYEADRIKCTMYREKLLDLASIGFIKKKGYALDAVVLNRFDRDISDGKHGKFSWRVRYHFLDHLPVADWPQDAVDYVYSDVEWAFKIYQAQKEQKAEPNTGLVYASSQGIKNEQETVAMGFSLNLASIWGFKVDQAQGARVEKRLHTKVDAAKKELIRAGVYRVNGSKNTKIIKALVEDAYTAKGAPTPTTEKGNTKACAKTLAASGDKTLLLLGSIAEEEKLLNSFVKMLHEPSIHPSYDALKVTGRSSSFKPNIQQIPRSGGIREAMVARPGFKLIMCDYSTLELRALAQITLNLPSVNQSTMAQALCAGQDLHLRLAADILHISYEEAQERIANGDKEVKDARQLAKVPNFGIPGGMTSPYSLMEYAEGYGITGMTYGEAQKLMDAWWKTWPEMREYFNWLDLQCDWSGDQTVVQHSSGRIRANTRKTAAANSYFQGLAADGGRAAVWAVQKACWVEKDSPLFGCRMNAYVHDEIIMEAPEGRWREAALELQRVMEFAMGQYVPDIPVIAEPAVADRWYKSAEPVYDDAGILQIWEPA